MCKRLIFLISVLVLSLVCTSQAFVVGDFEGSLDGWLPADATLSMSTIGATTGTGAMLIEGPGGWHINGKLDIKAVRQVLAVEGAAITADVTVFAEDMATDWCQVEMVINAQNNDDNGAHNNIGWNQLGLQNVTRDGLPHTHTWVLPDALISKIAGTDDNIAWFELMIISNNGADNTKFYVDNIQLVGAEPEPAKKIIYVDATEGEAGNTKLATGEVLTSTADGSGSDNLWRGRAFGNSATIFESGGQYGETANTEDCPRLMTSVEVPEDKYKVYAYFWADTSSWRIQASLTDSVSDLPLFLANDPDSEATVAVADDFEEPVPMLTDGNRTLWQVYLGTTCLTTMIDVYIDDDPNHLTHNGRTWYDGIGYKVAPPRIIYVDATEGEAGNTTLATGEIFTSTADGSGSDNLWRGRAFGNSATIFESGGQYGETANTEDCPRLMTFVDVPENDYEVYAYFWADGGPWRIQTSLENLEGDLPLFFANDPNSEATMADAKDFEAPVPMLSEGNRNLWQVYLGTTGITTMITVYIDDDPNHQTMNGRTWYDGIGYKVVTPTFSLAAVGDIELGNDAQLGPDSSSNGSGLGARDIPARRRVALISYDISELKCKGPISNVSFSHFSHDQHNEVSVYGIIEDLDLLDVESLTWNTAPGVQNDPTPELDAPVALDMNDLTDVLLTFTGPGKTGVRFSTDTSEALADFLNSDTDGIVTFLISASAVDTQLIIRARTHSSGGSFLEGELPPEPVDRVPEKPEGPEEPEGPVEPVDPGTGGLVAYYAFENNTEDSSGNGFHGTAMGDPTFVAGIGMAMDFDGDGDYIDCGNDPKFDITEQITVATWVNIRSIPQAWSAVVNKGDSAWRISNNNMTTGMHFGFENGTRGWQAANSETQLNLNEWYHVCGVYDISVGAKIYINGAEDASNPDKQGITISTYNVWIGDNSQTSDRRYWDGLIDEVMIYNRALSRAEVLYLAGK